MTEPRPPSENSPVLPASSASVDAGLASNVVTPAPKVPGFHLTPRSVYISVGLLAILVLYQLWWSHDEIGKLRLNLAHSLQISDLANGDARRDAKTAAESAKELQIKIGMLENRQLEAQSQQLALEQLYQDLSKNRDDWALAEIEQVLSTASQQLQLAGNVPGALIALQNADRSLSRSDKPQFIVIRRALANDIDQLKSLPLLDTTGIAVRLDSVISDIDSMPLLSDEKPSLPASPPKNSRRAPSKPATTTTAAVAEAPPEHDWLSSLDDKWQSWTDEMWGQIRQLIRVRTVDNPDALLLSPTQAYYARENLKLRLLNARLALLSRNESAFRSDMIAAQDEIGKYFDTRATKTQTAQTILRQVQSSNLSIEMPTLAESLNAVRNYKAK